MRAMKKRAALAITLGITGAMASQAVAQFTISNNITASSYSPYVATDDSGVSVGYTVLAVANAGLPGVEQNGPFPSAIIGTATGTLSGGVGIVSAYEFDATYGFRFIGENNSTTSTGAQSSAALAVNTAGEVIGTSPRDFSGSASSGVLGQDAWISTTTAGAGLNAGSVSTATLGLSGNGFYYANTSGYGTYSYSAPVGIDSSGDVVGTTSRYAGPSYTTPSTSLGTSAWYQPYGGTASEVGLTNSDGDFYNTTLTLAGGGTMSVPIYNDTPKATNTSGEVIGTATAYTGTTASTSLGNDAWVSIGGTGLAIGGINFNTSGGTLATTTVTAYGATQTVPGPTITGLGGSQFIGGYNATSGTAPTTFTYGYIPSGTIGTDYQTQLKRSTSAVAINAVGQVGLQSTYYSNDTYYYTGQDAYVYTPPTLSNGTFSPTAGIYAQVGLTTASWTANAGTSSILAGSTSFVNTVGQRSSTIVSLNDAGQAAGYSYVYVGTGSSYFGSGQAAWYASPAGGGAYNTPVQIGLYNTASVVPANESTTTTVHVQQTNTYDAVGAYSDTPSLMNKYGEVAGTSARYSSTGSGMGTDAWLYDPKNGGTTFVIDAAAEATNTYVSMNINYLSDSGVVVGQISTGSGTTSSGASAYSGFVWAEANPNVLINLDTSTSGLSTAKLQNIASSYFADLGGDTLLTSGLSTNPNLLYGTTYATVDSLETLTPEPGSLSILGIGAVVMLRRRRHRAAAPVASSAAAN